MKGVWVPHDVRDQIVDYVNYWTERAELPANQLLGWLQLGTSKFHQWKDRYGKANEHNGKVPRDWWLEDWEKQAVLNFHDRHPLNGYRRLAFMVLDDESPRIISDNGPQFIARDFKEYVRLMGMTHVRTSPFYPQSNGKLER